MYFSDPREGTDKFAGLSIPDPVPCDAYAVAMSCRIVSIPRERLEPWLTNFAARHGDLRVDAGPDRVEIRAADGAQAEIAVPFAPLADPTDGLAPTNGLPPTNELPPTNVLMELVRHVAVDRRVGAVLARKGGYGVGVFSGDQLLASKVGSSYVQGKTAAGGWSQQRFARRRDNQSRKAYETAADEVARVLVPEQESLVAVMTGGDKGAVAAVLADPRLAGLAALVQSGVLPVADPRLRVLEAFPAAFLAVRISLNELA